MNPAAPSWTRVLLGVVLTLALAVGACSSDGDGDDETTTDAGEASTESDDDATTENDADGGSDQPNACPPDGCQVFIDDAVTADGDEIQLTFRANYNPIFEQNHIHVFWDSQEPGAVSSDFENNGYDVQGKWHPTDEYPSYVTTADASTGAPHRGESTTVCVTAADTDHAVIDPGIFACLDVSDLLS